VDFRPITDSIALELIVSTLSYALSKLSSALVTLLTGVQASVLRAKQGPGEALL
jgi:hypothetical protein